MNLKIKPVYLFLIVIVQSVFCAELNGQVKPIIPINAVSFASNNQLEPDLTVFKKSFDRPNLRAEELQVWGKNNGFFVIYEKLDTLTFDHPFF